MMAAKVQRELGAKLQAKEETARAPARGLVVPLMSASTFTPTASSATVFTPIVDLKPFMKSVNLRVIVVSKSNYYPSLIAKCYRLM